MVGFGSRPARARTLPLSLLGALAEAFDESALPWKVDIVDRRTVGAAFGQIIDATRHELEGCGAA